MAVTFPKVIRRNGRNACLPPSLQESKTNNCLESNLTFCVCPPGGGVWRACHPRDGGALPGLCHARLAEDVLRDRH